MKVLGPPRARPIMPPKESAGFQSAPNLAGLVMVNNRPRGGDKRQSSFAMDLGSDIGDNKAIGGGYVGALPASLGTQMAYATGGLRSYARGGGDQDMFGRLMLARMNTLEEGFRDVVHELRGQMRRDGSRSQSRDRRGKMSRHQWNKEKGSERDAEKSRRPSPDQKERPKPSRLRSQRQENKPEVAEEWVDEEDDSLPVKGGSV